MTFHFTSIEPSRHYLEHHEKEVPWPEVVEAILTTKNPKKKGKNYEIENKRYYILFEVKDGTLSVINAKRNT